MKRSTKYSEQHETNPRPEAIKWRDVVGPLIRYDDLPEHIRDDSGAIVLKTTSGTRGLPSRQFDKNTINPTTHEVTINPHVSLAWRVVKMLDSSPWTNAATVLYPLQDKEKAYVDILISRDASLEAKRQVIDELVAMVFLTETAVDYDYLRELSEEYRRLYFVNNPQPPADTRGTTSPPRAITKS